MPNFDADKGELSFSDFAGKGLTLWLSFEVSNCEFVTFPLVSWYLIVSISDLCTLTYFKDQCTLQIVTVKYNRLGDLIRSILKTKMYKS